MGTTETTGTGTPCQIGECITLHDAVFLSIYFSLFHNILIVFVTCALLSCSLPRAMRGIDISISIRMGGQGTV